MYLKNGVIIAYVVNFYLLLVIIFGQHGIVDIFQERKAIKVNGAKYEEMLETNRVNTIKVGLMNSDIVDLRYLDELLRIQYSTIKTDEKVIIIIPNVGRLRTSNESKPSK